MLPGLRNIPTDEDDWNVWAWDHRASHDRIRQKIQQQYGVVLQDYLIEPISNKNLDLFLNNNNSLHDAMNSALGLVGTDLTDVDFANEQQLKAWIELHYLEHYNAESKVGA